MTPAARHQTAIEILDAIAGGEPAERALTRWARASRYAGSGDRAAVRDIVFDVLRQWTSTALRGGAETGRGRVLGLLRGAGVDPDTVFTGAPHAPAPLSARERAAGSLPDDLSDLPDWLVPALRASLGDALPGYALALRSRAPVFVRVNTLRTTRDAAARRLSQDGIESRPHPTVATALELVGHPRRLTQSAAYRDGWVELQDAASQAIVSELPAQAPSRVLDYCAGGGGKALALAARFPTARIVAHDISAARMRDLPSRAARAGAAIAIETAPSGGFDLVLADAPCSGSGTWRRAPEGLLGLTPQRLDAYTKTQLDVIEKASRFVLAGGILGYATCSVLAAENDEIVARFLAENRGFSLEHVARWTPGDMGDGFFLSVLRRAS